MEEEEILDENIDEFLKEDLALARRNLGDVAKLRVSEVILFTYFIATICHIVLFFFFSFNVLHKKLSNYFLVVKQLGCTCSYDGSNFLM